MTAESPADRDGDTSEAVRVVAFLVSGASSATAVPASPSTSARSLSDASSLAFDAPPDGRSI
jgi:hypothetical protein